ANRPDSARPSARRARAATRTASRASATVEQKRSDETELGGDEAVFPAPAAAPTGPSTATVPLGGPDAAVPVVPPARTIAPTSSLPDDRYLNRELSWLDFNARVLAL